jgi:hypothetical protein
MNNANEGSTDEPTIDSLIINAVNTGTKGVVTKAFSGAVILDEDGDYDGKIRLRSN